MIFKLLFVILEHGCPVLIHFYCATFLYIWLIGLATHCNFSLNLGYFISPTKPSGSLFISKWVFIVNASLTAEEFKVRQWRGERADSQRCEHFSRAFSEAHSWGSGKANQTQSSGGPVNDSPSVGCSLVCWERERERERLCEKSERACGTQFDSNSLKCRAEMCKFAVRKASR